MADGSGAFNFPLPQVSRLRPGEIVIDLFAGGGGASEALKQALGIDPALAYNHDEMAIGMHAANHPLTIHHREDIWHADPRVDVAGRLVGWFHASPDCTHFSQAKGGQPRDGKIRALSWVVLKWVGQLAKVGLAPRIISLENVWQILKWGPLVAKRDRATGRVLTMEKIRDPATGRMVYRVAAPGERVPIQNQQLMPDPRYLGRTWRQFVAALRAHGYAVEWAKLDSKDYGAGTGRVRLFMLARRDGEPIRWPVATHGQRKGLLPLVVAADSIDFSDLGRSIFGRRRPLADNTMRRIAKGLVKHVLTAADPFFLTEFANASKDRTWSAMEPLRTACARVKGGHFAMVASTLAVLRNNAAGADIRAPLRTVAAGGEHHVLVAAFLEQACGGYYDGAGHDLRKPAPTICAKGSIQRLITAQLEPTGPGETRGAAESPDVHRRLEQADVQGGGDAPREPGPVALTPEQEAGAQRVAAFLVKYHGTGANVPGLAEPMSTISTKDRLALVTVFIHGTPYIITDIKLRMLKPAELFRAQGFPPSYVIDRTADGRPITGTAAVRMVGNSVSPPPLRALAIANLDPIPDPVELQEAA